MVEISRVHASRILHLTAQSQPMSESSIGRSGSRTESGQHQAVPQRSVVDRAMGGFAKGAVCASRRCGVSL